MVRKIGIIKDDLYKRLKGRFFCELIIQLGQ
jgi:hypothetical protein